MADTVAGRTVWPIDADYACDEASGPAGRNYKTATGEMVEGQGRFRVRCQSVSGQPIAPDWRKRRQFTSVVECWRRDRQRSRALVGWKCWLHHPERFADSDSDAHVLRESL